MSDGSCSGYNPFDPAVIDDPYPHLARLRRLDPVHHSSVADGFWLITRHADAVDVLRNPADFSSAWGVGLRRVVPEVNSLVESDPPIHTFLRAIAARELTPKRVAQMAPRIEEIADRLCGEMVEIGDVDIVRAYTYPLTVEVIATVLGIPPEDRAVYKRWSDEMIGGLGEACDGSRARAECMAYFRDAVRDRRARPKDDMVTRLLQPAREGRALTTDEAARFCLILLVAGNQPSNNGLGNLIHALGRHPDARARLYRHDRLVPQAVEESLRYDPPNQAIFRHTTRDLCFQGKSMKAGTKVMVSVGAANRDPAAFPDPDHFDLDRRGARHLAFGFGIHACLGGSLATLEMAIALRSILRRTRDFEIADAGPPRFQQIFHVRALEALRIRWTR